MEITGKIIMDLGETSGTSKAGNAWKKHEWVLETGEQYPRKVKFHIFGNKLDNLQVPVELMRSYTLKFDIESREFNGRWYTDIAVYDVQPADGAVPPVAPQPSYGAQQPFGAAPAQPFTAEPAPAFPEPAGSDDLPF